MEEKRNNQKDENIVIEICCGSYKDAAVSYRAGIKRIELNSALYMGGLTPSLATLKLTKKNTDLKVITMIRPRGAGFCYDKEDFEVMKLDAMIMMENGADGLAFGCLTPERSVNISQTRELIEITKKYNGEAVFHRAFDCVKNPYKTVELLIDLGADRILTSGQKPRAIEGVELISNLQKEYGNKIDILPASGINSINAMEIMEKTGTNQIHSSCKDWVTDITTSGEYVNFSYGHHPHENDYDIVSEKLVNLIQNH